MLIEKTHIVAADSIGGQKARCSACGAEIQSARNLFVGDRVGVIVGTAVGSYSSYLISRETSETPKPCR